MNTILWIVTNLFSIAAIAIVVVLQPELRKALEETAILGIPTNRDFLIGLCGDPDVREGNFDISYIENVLMNKPAAKLDSEVETAALTAATARLRPSLESAISGTSASANLQS